ncbi:hypothetical protein Tco_1043122 [Tanacetum coccineum]|uniref:Uncharacterized protein n=1 Tax=Tanacetum coccineum TaxID=301880 RepID=A0ABQ5GL56_9ASTR
MGGSANAFDTPHALLFCLLLTAISASLLMIAIANEDNDAANEAAGSAAEAHLVPPSPPISPVREPTPEKQPASERPPSPSQTPPAQTFMFAKPLVFGWGALVPRPAWVCGVHDCPQPRPDNYLEPEDLDNIISMEDDTTHGGFYVESPVGPDDAPTPTADAAGRAEDPALLTSLSVKIDRCMGRIDSLETELGKSKKIMGGAILTLVSRVKKLEKTVKKRGGTETLALGHDQHAFLLMIGGNSIKKEDPLRRKLIELHVTAIKEKRRNGAALAEIYLKSTQRILLLGVLMSFFLDSDEDEQIGMSRVAADPDSDDETTVKMETVLINCPHFTTSDLVETSWGRREPRKASSASAVHRIVFLSIQLLSALKKGSDFSTPFERNQLSAASFPLRLYTPLSVFGGSKSVTTLTFKGLALIPCLVMRCPRNGYSSTLKEHFFGLSFMLMDLNLSKVS